MEEQKENKLVDLILDTGTPLETAVALVCLLEKYQIVHEADEIIYKLENKEITTERQISKLMRSISDKYRKKAN